LELPHRNGEDTVHDFKRALRPSIHKEAALKNPKTLHDLSITKSGGNSDQEEDNPTLDMPARRHDHSNFSGGVEEVDNESEEEPHGAIDEKPRGLYDILRLTGEEVDIFKTGGKCFIFHKRGQIAIDCPDSKNKKNDIVRKPQPGK
jgi:hypothetical protein